MQTADLALELLLIRGQDGEARARARVLARRLSEENTRRQEQEAAILAAAKRAIDHDLAIGAHNMLVVADEGWHRGVVGIVASKLVESYCKPALVLSIEDGLAHGSARSIPGFDMLAALENCADLFLRFGGHKQAAGVTLEAARVGELRRRLSAWANDRLTPDDLIPRLTIHAPMGLREISPDVLDGLTKLGPFGAANPKPVFRAGPVALMGTPRTIKERHLKLLFKQDGRLLPAIAWRAADRSEYLAANRDGLELAYSVEAGEYQGVPTTELTVADVRVPPGACA
jgi:single-stranded-DNA-specific exonuclease